MTKTKKPIIFVEKQRNIARNMWLDSPPKKGTCGLVRRTSYPTFQSSHAPSKILILSPFRLYNLMCVLDFFRIIEYNFFIT